MLALQQKIKLIVALGNPGTKYSETRHNAGVWLANRLQQKYESSAFIKDKVTNSLVSEVKIANCSSKIILPQVFMNNSGIEVGKYLRYYKISAPEMIVLHDEIDFPSGSTKLKFGGGCAGHNGLKSIKSHIGSSDFWRCRIGVGHPGHSDLVADYVLRKPTKLDYNAITASFEFVVAAFDDILQGDFEKAMRLIHN